MNALINLYHNTYSYNYSSYDVPVGLFISLMILVAFIVIIAVLSQVFLGLAVYNDAKAKGNSSPGMWGVLTGIFGWIPGIIYLCTRNSASERMIQCAYCGFLIPANAKGCPNCNNANPYAQQFYGTEAAVSKKRAKGFLIASICSYAALVLLVIAIVVVAVCFAAAASY